MAGWEKLTTTDAESYASSPSTGKVLKIAGDGSLEWGTDAAGTITALNNQVENRLVTIGSTTTQLDGEENLTFDGSVLQIINGTAPTAPTWDADDSVVISRSGNNNFIQMHTSNNMQGGIQFSDTLRNRGAIYYNHSTDAINISAGGFTSKMVIDANSNISLSNNDSGVGNTIFGESAGDPNGAGDYNIYIGRLAGGYGVQTDAADYNIGIGGEAGARITEGTSNILIGHLCGDYQTDGINNVAVGYSSCRDVGTGGANVVLGNFALSHTSAVISDSVFIGYEAGRGQLEAGANGTIAIGRESLNALTSGAANVAIGYQAGTDMTTSGYSVAIGWKALSAASSGMGDNTAIGYQSCLALNNVSSDGNTAIGANSMKAATNTTGNVAVGKLSLAALTTGIRNTSVGFESLDSLTVGDDNLAIGFQSMAGFSTTDGIDRNMAIGNYSLDGATTGAHVDNVLIGYASGGGTWDTSTANVGNVALGNNTMADAMLGAQYNIAIGFTAMNDLKKEIIVFVSALGLGQVFKMLIIVFL